MIATQPPSSVKFNKAVYWQEKIEAWKTSELTQRQFCKQNDLRFATFTYWRSRLSIRDPSKNGKVILPVKVKAPKHQTNSQQSIRIKLPHGVLIECPITLSQADMKNLFSVLGVISWCCFIKIRGFTFTRQSLTWGKRLMA